MTPEPARPLVLVGVDGEIAPLLTIVRTWAEAGFPEPVWFVQGVRHGRDHPFGDEIRALARRHTDLHLDISYSRARTTDVLGRDYQRNGRVNLATLKRLPPGPDADFALCGPTDVIAGLQAGLVAWGVPEGRIRQLGEPAPSASKAERSTSGTTVRFAASGVAAPWQDAHPSLLALAEAEGLNPRFSCRTGICQACLCPLLSGEVAYDREPLLTPAPGQVLICCSRPVGDVVLDL